MIRALTILSGLALAATTSTVFAQQGGQQQPCPVPRSRPIGEVIAALQQQCVRHPLQRSSMADRLRPDPIYH